MSNAILELAGWTLIHFLWQGMLVFALVWLSLRFLAANNARVPVPDVVWWACGAGPLSHVDCCRAVHVLAWNGNKRQFWDDCRSFRRISRAI